MPGKERFTNTRLPIIGGITAAIGASLCCIGPFLLLSLGISGAWIGNLTLLEPYRPVFVMLVMLLFGWAGWQIHRPVEACEPGTACAVPHTRKRRQIVFWIAVIVALVLVTSTHWIPLFA
ncbi:MULTISPECIES: mercuric transporter MerT family protein [Gammaproteobacteria]|jgi:mercuric ion transport protein|uniref:Mercuric transport protein MerT n=2 Tax=Gammaproteobacteria TaxID=1236 RepID=A0A9X1Z9G1_9GAMM|nr:MULTISPECIES: mercuric transporter MerT family protein [Gammaproteobacteria]EKT4486605.1 mercury transporter [Shewanella algae]MBO2547870.1 mercury transporter [Shewanella algae]MBO2624591.1 mercury transporter [Shewanella algae]MBO2696511.1 mercury transporter [Shewanella algae]MCB2388719.1 mercury transporter [Thalassolituus alkanivorans]|tara:strand:+ start:176 stop:535 length:360 start_codon:yes stop_codon:yes gene_type:complete